MGINGNGKLIQKETKLGEVRILKSQAEADLERKLKGFYSYRM